MPHNTASFLVDVIILQTTISRFIVKEALIRLHHNWLFLNADILWIFFDPIKFLWNLITVFLVKFHEFAALEWAVSFWLIFTKFVLFYVVVEV